MAFRPMSGLAPAPNPLVKHPLGGFAVLQALQIGIDGNELPPGQAGIDHPVDGISTSPAYADHLHLGAVLKVGIQLKNHNSSLLG